MNFSKETEQKIQQLQLMEQNIQQIITQKQDFQAKIMEIDSALEELKNSEVAYKIVGNIMVLSEKPSLEESLKSEKETLELRIKMLEKQEEKLREKIKNIQNQVLQEMKESNDKKGDEK